MHHVMREVQEQREMAQVQQVVWMRTMQLGELVNLAFEGGVVGTRRNARTTKGTAKPKGITGGLVTQRLQEPSEDAQAH